MFKNALKIRFRINYKHLKGNYMFIIYGEEDNSGESDRWKIANTQIDGKKTSIEK